MTHSATGTRGNRAAARIGLTGAEALDVVETGLPGILPAQAGGRSSVRRAVTRQTAPGRDTAVAHRTTFLTRRNGRLDAWRVASNEQHKRDPHDQQHGTRPFHEPPRRMRGEHRTAAVGARRARAMPGPRSNPSGVPGS